MSEIRNFERGRGDPLMIWSYTSTGFSQKRFLLAYLYWNDSKSSPVTQFYVVIHLTRFLEAQKSALEEDSLYYTFLCLEGLQFWSTIFLTIYYKDKYVIIFRISTLKGLQPNNPYWQSGYPVLWESWPRVWQHF